MDTTVLLESCARGGVLRQALTDAITRGERHFAGLAPTPAEADAWLDTTLRATAPHLFPASPLPQTPAPVPDVEQRFGVPQALWDTLSPEERLARARTLRPPVQRHRPPPLQLSSQQMAALAAMPAEQRLSAYRQLREEART